MHDKLDHMSYLGMVLTKINAGYEISMQSYIEDILELYRRYVKDCVTPAKLNLFTIQPSATLTQKDRTNFHSIVVKLLCLGKRGRPDILLAVQFLCMRVKQPNQDDLHKLERVLGYLQMTKNRARVIDDSPFERVETFIDAAFANHADSKGQSGCMVFLGKTLVHEACKKQNIVTKSLTEAELVALSDYMMEGELIEELVMDLRSMMDEDLVTNVHLEHQDYMSAIAPVTKGGGKSWTKYMRS
jgi:hypothetical protein